MNLIVMLQGVGINERGWAKLASNFGRVVLIQQGYIIHVEIWENGQRLFNGPNVRVTRWRKLDEVLFGMPTAIRVLFLTLKHTQKQPIDVIVATNYHCSLVAMLLKRFGKARKVVPFLTDFMPIRGSWLLRQHRRITGWLMRFVARRSDEVWILSPRIPTGRTDDKSFVVPICINEFQSPPRLRDEVAYIGYPSKDHALDILFDIARRHKLRLNIIGDSPYLHSVRHLAPPDAAFHGLMNDEERIGQILSRCFCGYCIYWDITPSSYSYYGFPSKTLYNFASNVPIVITNVAYFNRNFEDRGVGRVVDPDPQKIEEAILQLKSQYPRFSAAIDRFRKDWNQHVLDFHRQRLKALGCRVE